MGPFIFLIALVAPATWAAERTCKASGIFTSTDPRKFIVCRENDGKLQAVVGECSKGQVFDITRQTCTSALRSFQALYQVFSNNTSTPSWGSTTGRPPTTTLPPVVRECKNPGAICSTCNTLSFCVGEVSNGTQVVRKILDYPCGYGSVCVSQQGCVSVLDGGLCREGSFKCGDIGLYPDPYDCTKYHDCTPGYPEPVDHAYECPPSPFGRRWDPKYSRCGWSEDAPTCKKTPVPLCLAPLQMGPAGGQVYYICLLNNDNPMVPSLEPKLFRCQRNLVFNATSYSCQNPL